MEASLFEEPAKNSCGYFRQIGQDSKRLKYINQLTSAFYSQWLVLNKDSLVRYARPAQTLRALGRGQKWHRSGASEVLPVGSGGVLANVPDNTSFLPKSKKPWVSCQYE